MSLDIEAGMGSCTGAAGADAAWGAGKDAAIVAAIEVAIAVLDGQVTDDDEQDKTKSRGGRGRLVIHLSMSPSRTARLYFLLVLDLLFFVLEISIGKLSRSSQGSPC